MAEQEQSDYRCPMCGNEKGTPNPNGSEDWYWRVLPVGRVGPFCSEECVRRLISDQAHFSLEQVQRMEFWRYQALREDRACVIPAIEIATWMDRLEERSAT